MIAARLRRLPAMLHEQNAVLGKANRLVLGGAARVATSFAPHALHRRRRSPRAAGRQSGARDRAGAAQLALSRARRRAGWSISLVFGGSQGAASFSQVIPEAVLSLPAPLRARLRLVQQCRPEDLEQVRQRYAAGRHRGRAGAVLRRPAAALAAAHLVIGRSGASTVAELATIGRPSILVPYPYAADDHQTANARAFEAAGACIVIPHADFTRRRPWPAICAALVEAPQRLAAMAAAAHAAGRPDAAARLADLVGEMIAAPALSPSGVAA